VPSRRTRISDQRAEALLFPIAAFLQLGGLDQQAATRRLSAAFRRTRKMLGGRRIEHIGQPILYADIVTRWSRDSRYLDSSGRPRALSMEGRQELASLIRSVSPESDPRSVVQVLARFGNVRKASNGKYRLVRSMFSTSTNQAMAFVQADCAVPSFSGERSRPRGFPPPARASSSPLSRSVVSRSSKNWTSGSRPEP